MVAKRKGPEVTVKAAQLTVHTPVGAPPEEKPVAASVVAFLVDGSSLTVPNGEGLSGATVAAEEVFRKGYLELGVEHEGRDYYPVSQIRRICVRLVP